MICKIDTIEGIIFVQLDEMEDGVQHEGSAHSYTNIDRLEENGQYLNTKKLISILYFIHVRAGR